MLLRAAQCSVAERSVAQWRFLSVAVVCCRLRQRFIIIVNIDPHVNGCVVEHSER
jgi:hypothetical protein